MSLKIIFTLVIKDVSYNRAYVHFMKIYFHTYELTISKDSNAYKVNKPEHCLTAQTW